MTGNRLKGKVALVTGSTRGLGEHIATGFAAEGASVAVTGRNESDGLTVVERIRAAGGVAEFIPLDISREESIVECVNKTARHFGSIDILVNNAAPTELITGAATSRNGEKTQKADASVTDLSTENWRKIVSAGVDGLFWVLKHTIAEMQNGKGGSIINISSIGSIMGAGGNDAYIATKGAMNSLTRSIAVNYAQNNIRCNCLIVGLILTDSSKPYLAVPGWKQAMLDTMCAQDIATPGAIVGPAVFFASDESYYVTGQSLPVDGGMSIKMPFPKF